MIKICGMKLYEFKICNMCFSLVSYGNVIVCSFVLVVGVEINFFCFFSRKDGIFCKESMYNFGFCIECVNFYVLIGGNIQRIKLLIEN